MTRISPLNISLFSAPGVTSRLAFNPKLTPVWPWTIERRLRCGGTNLLADPIIDFFGCRIAAHSLVELLPPCPPALARRTLPQRQVGFSNQQRADDRDCQQHCLHDGPSGRNEYLFSHRKPGLPISSGRHLPDKHNLIIKPGRGALLT